MKTDHKPLVVIFKTDMATWHKDYIQSYCAYTIRGLESYIYLGWQLYKADWISRHNHTESKDEEITGMNLSINVIKTCTDIPKCMMVEKH